MLLWLNDETQNNQRGKQATQTSSWTTARRTATAAGNWNIELEKRKVQVAERDGEAPLQHPPQNQPPAVSPEIQCPPTPRRRRSLDLCHKKYKNTFSQWYPSLCRAAMKRPLKKIAVFGGSYRRISPTTIPGGEGGKAPCWVVLRQPPHTPSLTKSPVLKPARGRIS